MNEREKSLLFRVGFFVSLGLGILVVFVFMLGGEGGVFKSYQRYASSFESIDGLKAGSSVRLAGVQVGQVTSISFYDEVSDARVRVEMNVLSRYADRIREDSTATISAQGVLGDKVVELSLGSPELPQIPANGEIQSATGSDYTTIINKGAAVIDNTLAITSDLRELVASYNTPQLREDVGGSVASLRHILETVTTQDGALHALIFDPATGQRTREILESTSLMAKRVDASMARVDSLLGKVDRGEGLVGSLFAPEGEQLLADLGMASREIGALVQAIRMEEDGLVHGLIYGSEDGSTMGKELATAATELRQIISRINAGEGSLGAIINDPTVYDDLKTVLGNVKRNAILRALVRYSISNRDEIESYGSKE